MLNQADVETAAFEAWSFWRLFYKLFDPSRDFTKTLSHLRLVYLFVRHVSFVLCAVI